MQPAGQLSRRTVLTGMFATLATLATGTAAEAAIPTLPKEPRMFILDEQAAKQTALEQYNRADASALEGAARCVLEQEIGLRSAVVIYTGEGVSVNGASRIAHQLSRDHDTEVYCVPIDQGANGLFARHAGELEVRLLGTVRSVNRAQEFLAGPKNLRDFVPMPLPFSTVVPPHDGEGSGLGHLDKDQI